MLIKRMSTTPSSQGYDPFPVESYSPPRSRLIVREAASGAGPHEPGMTNTAVKMDE